MPRLRREKLQRSMTASERELALAAKSAAQAMITEGQLNWAEQEGYHLVPVRRHIVNAAVAEVYRLKYPRKPQRPGMP